MLARALNGLLRRPSLVVITAVAATAAALNPSQPIGTFAAAWAIGYVLLGAVRTAWETQTWPKTARFARPKTDRGSWRGMRADNNARFFRDRGGFLFAERFFFEATGLPPHRVTRERYDALAVAQRSAPTLVAEAYGRRWWWFEDEFVWENDGLSSADVLALVRERQRRKRRQLQRAHDLLAVDALPPSRRQPIPRDVRQAVFRRDGGRCVECDNDFDLQYDHILPVAHGGGTTLENLQLLCGSCNRHKSDSI